MRTATSINEALPLQNDVSTLALTNRSSFAPSVDEIRMKAPTFSRATCSVRNRGSIPTAIEWINSEEASILWFFCKREVLHRFLRNQPQHLE